MRERLIASEPGIIVFATEAGEIVLEQLSSEADVRPESVRIPYQKVHQVTLWMRRLAAEFDGLSLPPEPPRAESSIKVI